MLDLGLDSDDDDSGDDVDEGDKNSGHGVVEDLADHEDDENGNINDLEGGE